MKLVLKDFEVVEGQSKGQTIVAGQLIIGDTWWHIGNPLKFQMGAVITVLRHLSEYYRKTVITVLRHPRCKRVKWGDVNKSEQRALFTTWQLCINHLGLSCIKW
jgi:hypothetical protein